MEKRTDYIQMKTLPSVKEKAKKRARAEGRTLSNYIESLIIADWNKNGGISDEWKAVIIQTARNYDDNEYERFLAECGWQPWMENYTTADDGEMCSEREVKEIEEIQRELWEVAHPQK